MFSVLTRFKNESTNINEWIEHYLWQGATELHMIDNNSDDNWKDNIKPEYLTDKRINFYIDTRVKRQVSAFNDFFKKIKFKTPWVLVLDMDEFVYCRKDYNSINDYLKTIPNKVSQIQIPWKVYGSHNLDKQPASIRGSFLTRHKYPRTRSNFNERISKYDIECKYFVRAKDVKKLDIHFATVTGKTIKPDGSRVKNVNPFIEQTEETLESHPIHLNHYVVQSKDYFYNIKKKRGGGNNPKHIQDADDFFTRHDKDTDYFDDELKKLLEEND